MGRLPEIISTVRRRRAWSVEEKVAILDAAFSRGGSVAAAADAFGVSRSLVYIWRQQVRDGLMPGVTMTSSGVSAFAAVAIKDETIKNVATKDEATKPGPVSDSIALPASASRSCRPKFTSNKLCGERRPGSLEVLLVNGRSIKVDDSIAPEVLARLVAVLDGGTS